MAGKNQTHRRRAAKNAALSPQAASAHPRRSKSGGGSYAPRPLAAALALCGLFGVAPAVAFAADDTPQAPVPAAPPQAPVPVPAPPPIPGPVPQAPTPPVPPVPVPVPAPTTPTPQTPIPAPTAPTAEPAKDAPATPAVPDAPDDAKPEGDKTVPATTPAATPAVPGAVTPLGDKLPSIKNGKTATTGGITIKDDRAKGRKDKNGDDVNLDETRQFGAGNASRFLGKFGRELNVTGGMSLTSRQQSVAGQKEAREVWDQQNNNTFYDGTKRLGPFQQNMDMTIQGRIFNAFSVNARLTNNRQGNYFNQVFGFDYKSKGTSFNIGDVNAALPGNELVSFARNLQGIMVSRDFGGGRMKMTGIASYTRAVTRRGTFQGQGTSGPYYLNASSIIEGTEKVRLNGTQLAPGSDYTIDFLLGTLNFVGGRIINPEDTVEYTYEAQNYSSQPGLLSGMRWDYNAPGGNTLGLTYLTQRALSGSSGVNEITERFPVSSDISYRYQLASLIDQTAPVEVTWRDQLLLENVDYQINRDLRFILLKRALPPDTSITGDISLRVKYKPQRQASTSGDRSVMGIDSLLHLSKNATFGVQFGQSDGATSSQKGTGLTATASLSSNGRGDKNAWQLTTEMRSIGQGFSNIDSVSGAFLRAEKGFRTQATFSPNQWVNLTSNFTNSKVGTQDYTTSSVGGGYNQTPTLSWADNRQMNFGATVGFPNLPTLNFSHQQTTQNNPSYTGASTSKFMNQSLSLDYNVGQWGFSSALRRTSSQGRSVFSGYSNSVSTGLGLGSTGLLGTVRDGNFGQTATDSGSTSTQFSASWAPAQWLGFKGSMGLSKTKFGSGATFATSGSGSDARDLSFGFALTPRTGLSIQANIGESTNGQSTSSFYGNTATSTATTGLPTATQIGYSLTGQRTRSTTLNVAYAPSDKLSLGWDFTRALSLVPGYDNTQNNTNSLLFSFSGLRKMQITGQWSNQQVTYVGGQGSSGSQSYTMSATAGPFGKLSFTSTLQRLNTGSAIYSGVSGVIGGNGLTPGVGDGGLTTRGRQTTTNAVANAALYDQRQTIDTLSFRTDYGIGGGKSLFLEWQTIGAASPFKFTDDTDSSTNNSQYAYGAYHTAYNYNRSTGRVGLDIRLTEFLGFSLDYNLINLKDSDDAKYSYRAKAMNMDLSARF